MPKLKEKVRILKPKFCILFMRIFRFKYCTNVSTEPQQVFYLLLYLFLGYENGRYFNKGIFTVFINNALTIILAMFFYPL